MPPPSDNALQVFYGTLPVVGAILLANWNNNKRLDDLNKRLDDLHNRLDDMKGSLHKRMDDLALQMNTGFAEVKASIARLESRVSDLEKGHASGALSWLGGERFWSDIEIRMDRTAISYER